MLGDLGKLIVAKGFKKLPKVQKIARSGHTDYKIRLRLPAYSRVYNSLPKRSVLAHLSHLFLSKMVKLSRGSFILLNVCKQYCEIFVTHSKV